MLGAATVRLSQPNRTTPRGARATQALQAVSPRIAATVGIGIVSAIALSLIGGAMADRWVDRVLGARVVIPAVCITVSGALFMVSFVPMPFAAVIALQLAAFLAAAHVRGTGFGAFNVASVVFGAAAAPIVTSAIATAFGGNFRVAFAIEMPIAFVGAAFLLAARRHIEQDTAKIFEAVVLAIAADQADQAGQAAPGGDA